MSERVNEIYRTRQEMKRRAWVTRQAYDVTRAITDYQEHVLRAQGWEIGGQCHVLMAIDGKWGRYEGALTGHTRSGRLRLDVQHLGRLLHVICDPSVVQRVKAAVA